MNALGHKMLHVHSDERGTKDRWSAEVVSSGATAGSTLTDRVKGLQKGGRKVGSQWTMHSEFLTRRSSISRMRQPAMSASCTSRTESSPSRGTKERVQRSHGSHWSVGRTATADARFKGWEFFLVTCDERAPAAAGQGGIGTGATADRPVDRAATPGILGFA